MLENEKSGPLAYVTGVFADHHFGRTVNAGLLAIFFAGTSALILLPMGESSVATIFMVSAITCAVCCLLSAIVDMIRLFKRKKLWVGSPE